MALAEGFVRVRLHRALAERIADRYLADAGEMDARFFAARPVMASAPSAAAERQADDLHEMLDAGRLGRGLISSDPQSG